MNLDRLDWDALERLRSRFLQGQAGQRDYWLGEGDLAAYDQTFGRRISWKWDFVLDELRAGGWSPPAGPILDWGCGPGVAARTYLAHFPGPASSEAQFHDRSEPAMRFAQTQARREFPRITTTIGGAGCKPLAVVLLSHVLTELTPHQVDELLSLAATATVVLWVEPGTHHASRSLIAARERLRGQFNVIFPCTHKGACGMLSPGNEQHWCHQFAPSPPEAFTDGNWVRFGRLAGIDLRSLPLSCLVLDKRPVAALPGGSVRLIGRPAMCKGHAVLFGCDENGVYERRLPKRAAGDEFRLLKRGELHRLDAAKLERVRGRGTGGEDTA